jgi:hypothetical protein
LLRASPSLSPTDSLAELCYQKSIDSLNEADYMNNHSLFSLQAICVLIYIGHNIGQSDRISVLLACAVRIAQCLCLHRLGPDNNTPRDSTTPSEAILVEDIQRRLIEREISKRVWWFLVRQDWLQIPFNNTYTIHPTQFNTPMPFNCDEEIANMFDAQGVVDHEQEHYTQGSYTMVLNHGASALSSLSLSHNMPVLTYITCSGSAHLEDAGQTVPAGTPGQRRGRPAQVIFRGYPSRPRAERAHGEDA